MSGIRIDTSQLAAWIARSRARIQVSIPATAAGILREDIARQFAIGGEPSWTPLSPVTLRAKAHMGYPRLSRNGMAPVSSMQNRMFSTSNILMRTMALYSSYTNPQDPDHVERADSKGAYVGSSIIYAAVHQYGHTVTMPSGKQVRIPARPLVVSDQAVSKIAAALDRSLGGN